MPLNMSMSKTKVLVVCWRLLQLFSKYFSELPGDARLQSNEDNDKMMMFYWKRCGTSVVVWIRCLFKDCSSVLFRSG